MDAIPNVLKSTVAANNPAMTLAPTRPTATDSDHAQRAKAEVSSEEVAAAIARASRRLEQVNTRVTFSVDKDLGRVVVQVINPDTHEVVRQIPPQEFLDLAHQLDTLGDASGLLADKIA